MLKELIDWLKQQDPNLTVPQGFGSPHSYRGYYEDVAFSPEENVTFGQMLEHAQSALGATFTGWKGGEYTMEPWTACWIAEPGSTDSEVIDEDLMDEWLELAK